MVWELMPLHPVTPDTMARITGTGQIILSRGHHTQIGSPVRVDVLVDRERRAIGIRASQEGVAGRAVTVRSPTKVMVAAQTALTQLGFRRPLPKSVPVAVEGDLLVLRMGEPSEREN